MVFRRYFTTVQIRKKYFLGTIKQPVCRKMCSKNFENRLTNKKVLVKNIFEFPVQKNLMEGRYGKYFPAKNFNSNYLIMIAQNYYKLTQMTYLRQKLHDQAKILEKNAFSRSSIISLANAKSLCKNHFGHKNFICSRIFKIFSGPIRTN